MLDGLEGEDSARPVDFRAGGIIIAVISILFGLINFRLTRGGKVDA